MCTSGVDSQPIATMLDDLLWVGRLASPFVAALAAGVLIGVVSKSGAVSSLVAGAWLGGLWFWRDLRWRWF